MTTELSPKLKSGFFLNQIELTRIKDLLNEQIKKINNGQDARFIYEVKYLNGAISKPSELEEILAEENDGSGKIIRVCIRAFPDIDDAGYIEINFSDISNSENSDKNSITYSVKSEDKDWVFVTASTIEERINKVKVGAVIEFFSNDSNRSMMTLTFMMIATLMVTLVTTPSTKMANDQVTEIYNKFKDPIEFAYNLKILEIGTKSNADNAPIALALIGFAIIASHFLLGLFSKWYPIYTFYWGDNIEKYRKKKNILKFIFVGVVFTITISVIANYISSKIL